MKKIFIIILCCILLLVSCVKQPSPKAQPAEITPEVRVSQYLKDLTVKEMEGRRAGSRGESRAALYLARFYQKAGLQPLGDLGTYFQTFPLGRFDPVLVDERMTFRSAAGGTVNGENILGVLPGKEPGYIVVSAHYDHLGVINNKLYPGANDNASGVAAVLELINQLKGQRPQYTILFAMWSAEEEGLLGSEYFCQKPTIPLEQIRVVLNLDSIGYLKAEREIMGWTALENEASQDLIQSLEQDGWQFIWEKSDKHNSDQASFNKRGIAGFTLISPNWLQQNHTPEDLPNQLRIEPMLELVGAIRKVLLK